tara:strand:- start:370 stop:633 length:264 start_codon:yes stop_codon:yes gene_type:complete
MAEINIEQAEAMFHKGLDVCGDALDLLDQPHRDPSPAEVSGLLTGLLGFVIQKAGGPGPAQDVLDQCWTMALDGHRVLIERERAEDV